MCRDLGPHLTVSVSPESGETSRVVVYPVTHQRTGILAATLLFVLVPNHLGLPFGYRTPTQQTLTQSAGRIAGPRLAADEHVWHPCSPGKGFGGAAQPRCSEGDNRTWLITAVGAPSRR